MSEVKYSTEILELLDAVREACRASGYVSVFIDDVTDYAPPMTRAALLKLLADAYEMGLMRRNDSGNYVSLTKKGEEVAS